MCYCLVFFCGCVNVKSSMDILLNALFCAAWKKVLEIWSHSRVSIFSCNNLISSEWRCRGVFTSMVAHVRDCVLCEWLWEMAVCWMASVVLGPRAHSDRSLLQILGPLVSLSAVCHAGWFFHLLAESSGVKSLSKNGLPLMTMWHMKWLLLYESLCVSRSQTRVEFRWDCRVYSAPGQILLWHWASIFIHCPEMMTQTFKILCNSVKSCKCWLTPATVTVHYYYYYLHTLG